MREEVWGRRRFLGEEGEEEDREAKKAGCSPWRMVGIVALAAGTVALKGTVAGIAASALAGIEASALMGIALVKES